MLVNLCIMAGGNKIATQSIGPFQQSPPFNMRIAQSHKD